MTGVAFSVRALGHTSHLRSYIGIPHNITQDGLLAAKSGSTAGVLLSSCTDFWWILWKSAD